MQERRLWTSEEDRILKDVFETNKLTKWSQIARTLQEDYGIKGRNGKQCKERYITHIDTSHPKQEWSYSLEQRMLELHNELGNKWAVIGHRMGGISDNSIKNHFYSLLRRALRKLNIVIGKEFSRQLKQFKPAILYRIVEVADEKSRLLSQAQHEFAENSHQLKNQLIEFSYDENIEQTEEPDIDVEEARLLIAKVAQFALQYKKRGRRSRKGSGQGQNLLSTRKFQIKKLNAENEDLESSYNMNSEEGSNLEETVNREINNANGQARLRKPSYRSLNADLMIEEEPMGMRTRARSQGSVANKFLEKPNFTMTEEKPLETKGGEGTIGSTTDKVSGQAMAGHVSDQLEVEGILSGYQLLEEGDPMPPMVVLQKRDSSFSRLSFCGGDRNDSQFHFFDDSGYELRVLPEMEMTIRRESQMDENIFG